MKLQFKPAQKSDIDIIFSLNKELIDTYENVKSIEYGKVLEWVYKKIEEHINEYMCIIVDNQKAGYYYFHQINEGMEIDDLYIFPEFQNKGIGTAIIKKCCSETCKPVYLYVFSGNKKAIALYEKLGFRIIKEIRDTRYLMCNVC